MKRYSKYVKYVLMAYIITRLVNYYNNDFNNLSIFSGIVLSSLFVYILYLYYTDYKKDKLEKA